MDQLVLERSRARRWSVTERHFRHENTILNGTVEPLAARGRARPELVAEREEIRLGDGRRDDEPDPSERHALLLGGRRGQRCGSYDADEQVGLGERPGHGCVGGLFRSFALELVA